MSANMLRALEAVGWGSAYLWMRMEERSELSKASREWAVPDRCTGELVFALRYEAVIQFIMLL